MFWFGSETRLVIADTAHPHMEAKRTTTVETPPVLPCIKRLGVQTLVSGQDRHPFEVERECQVKGLFAWFDRSHKQPSTPCNHVHLAIMCTADTTGHSKDHHDVLAVPERAKFLYGRH